LVLTSSSFVRCILKLDMLETFRIVDPRTSPAAQRTEWFPWFSFEIREGSETFPAGLGRQWRRLQHPKEVTNIFLLGLVLQK